MGFEFRPPEAYKKVYITAPYMGVEKIKKIRPPYKTSPGKGGRGKKGEEDEKIRLLSKRLFCFLAARVRRLG